MGTPVCRARVLQDSDDGMELLIGDGGVGEGAIVDVTINRWNGPAATTAPTAASAAAAVAAAASAAPGDAGAGTAGSDGGAPPTASAPPASSGSRSIFMQMFEQLFDSIPPRRLRQSRRPWRIEFEGEGGQDAGGLFSESLTMLVQELCGGATALFIPTPNAVNGVGTDRDKLLPNPAAASPTDLYMFEFVGRLMGVGVRLGFPLPFSFPSLVWRQFVREPGCMQDLAAVDFTFAAHLKAVAQVGHCRRGPVRAASHTAHVLLALGAPSLFDPPPAPSNTYTLPPLRMSSFPPPWPERGPQ
jgi:hypothetical protein